MKSNVNHDQIEYPVRSVETIKSTGSIDSINTYINNIKTIISNSLKIALNINPSQCSKLHNAIEYTALSNGKRLRAALVFSLIKPNCLLENITSNLDSNIKNNLNYKLLLDSAMAIELIHTYSIVHDDLPSMDNDDFRRGQPSCHKQFDEATAILVGDSLQSLAFDILSTTNKTNQITSISSTNIDSNIKKRFKIINLLSKAIGPYGMVAGQSLELNRLIDNKQPNSVIKHLNKIHNLKTGKLFTACLQSAAIASNFNSEQYKLMTELGDTLGLAFQIQDDLLDSMQSSDKLGKPANSDEKRGLITYSNVLSPPEVKSILDDLWDKSQNLVKKIEHKSSILKDLITFISKRQY